MSELNPQPLFDWANERHKIYLRKQEGKFPLTQDPILSRFRFCNVFRELDRVSVWVRENIREEYPTHQDLWFMLATARTFNWPPTLDWLMVNNSFASWPSRDGFSPDEMARALDVLHSWGNKIYTGAYLIRAESNPKAHWFGWPKHHYISKIVLGRLWEDRAEWRQMMNSEFLTLREVWEKFQQPRYIGWGPFMAYQVVVDLRHTQFLSGASDINTWAAVGPGSRRGINRLLGRSPTAKLTQDEALGYMREIYEVQSQYRAEWLPQIDLSDIQNCLCETDKYLRVKNGEGRPRAAYVAGRGY
jgi:hypothetical protein